MFTVAIDPGHGGYNTGTVKGRSGVDQVIEKEWTLSLAKQLAAALATQDGIVPVLLRDDDYAISQKTRGELSKKCGADFVLSIHVNANADVHVRGFEAYYWPNSRAGRHIARALCDHAPIELRKRRAAAISVSRERGKWIENPRSIVAAHKSPTVLAEVGFASNSADRRFLLSAHGQLQVVGGLLSGVGAAREFLRGLP